MALLVTGRWIGPASAQGMPGAGSGPAEPAAAALPAELREELPAARLLGQARMRWLGLRIYDIRLWAEQAPGSDPVAQPLALELRYARALDGTAIAERSLQEMRRVRADLAPDEAERWLDAMRRLFPDVAAGDRLTGVHRPRLGARFFHNGRRLGEVAEPAFTQAFFGIWLSERTSAPDLRAELLKGAS